jgi:hypothetical protein
MRGGIRPVSKWLHSTPCKPASNTANYQRINHAGQLQGKLTMLEVRCHRCERRCRVSLARPIEEHGADTGLPDLWEEASQPNCPNARTTAVHNRCATY